MADQVITLKAFECGEIVETQVRVVRETPKAILVAGNCSEAWFPKKGIDAEGFVAQWVTFSISHCFLFHSPYTLN